MTKLKDISLSHQNESNLTLSRSWGIELSIFLKILLILSFQTTQAQKNQIKYNKKRHFLEIPTEMPN